MPMAVTHDWVIRALFAVVACINSGCSVTPVSVREISGRPMVHGEGVNLPPSLGSLGTIASGQIVEKGDLNLGEQVATRGFSRSGLVIQRILLAENYEIKGLLHRHRTSGEGEAAVTLLIPQPKSPLRAFYTADYVYVPVTIMNSYGPSRIKDERPGFRMMSRLPKEAGT